MEVRIDRTFQKDLSKINDRKLRKRIVIIIENVSAAESANDIKDIKKLKGTKNYYRIKTGDYRLGLVIEGGAAEFIRCLHRKDIYRFFPK